MAWARHVTRRHGAGPLAWRWFTGHPLDGRHRTDATWTRKAGSTLHPVPVVRWHHLPRLYRAGIRTGATVAAAVLAVMLAEHRKGTTEVLAAAGLLAGLLLGWRVYHLTRRFRHYRTWQRPLSRALVPVLDGPPARLEIQPDRSRVLIGLPEEFTGSDRERDEIARAVSVKLAIEAPEADWSKLHGKRRRSRSARATRRPRW